MPAYVGGEYDVFGIKWIAGFPKNPARHGLPRATGFFVLNDSWKGIPAGDHGLHLAQRDAHRGRDRRGGQVHGPA